MKKSPVSYKIYYKLYL